MKNYVLDIKWSEEFIIRTARMSLGGGHQPKVLGIPLGVSGVLTEHADKPSSPRFKACSR